MSAIEDTQNYKASFEQIAEKYSKIQDKILKAELVEVVRCGECIHRHDPRRFSCQGRHMDWFCADGVRRRP